MRFNYPSGTFIDFFVPDGSGGLTAPFHLMFGADRCPTLTYTLYRDCLDNVDDPGMRDGAFAVRLAKRGSALRGNRDPAMLDALAAAWAEVRRFDLSVESATKAADLAAASGNKSFAEAIHNRLQLSRSGRPFHSGRAS